jgi:hypothetical protein
MFQVTDYRQAESAARARVHNWRMAEAQTVDTFIRVGFPVRIDHPHEVGQLVDTMQEGRFESYMKEFNGINEVDRELLVRALVSSIQFQASQLPIRTPVAPISTMMSALGLYRKIRGFNPEVGNVLEVGPGCGYLSFFLRQHAALNCYAQVEACESFYFFQAMVNRHLWGGHFLEDLQRPESRNVFSTMQQDIDHGVSIDRTLLGQTRCRHYPWWSLDRVIEECTNYSIVTSNANLNEMTRQALRDYLAVFHKVLAPDGIFLVQCTGSTGNGTDNELFDILTESGWAPVFCALTGTSSFKTSKGTVKSFFPLNNIVMVRKGHPLHAKAYGRSNFRSGFMVEAPWLERMFFGATGVQYTRAEIITMVKDRIRDLAAAGELLPTFPL